VLGVLLAARSALIVEFHVSVFSFQCSVSRCNCWGASFHCLVYASGLHLQLCRFQFSVLSAHSSLFSCKCSVCWCVGFQCSSLSLQWYVFSVQFSSSTCQCSVFNGPTVVFKFPVSVRSVQLPATSFTISVFSVQLPAFSCQCAVVCVLCLVSSLHMPD